MLAPRVFVLLLVFVFSCTSSPKKTDDAGNIRTVTLLFTNDFESAYDPTTAFWRDDLQHIGGVAQLATLIDSLRNSQPNVFLFDAGDIFTGTLSKLTLGELPFELMITMGYDAMAIGNHEFEYGWEEFIQQKHRAPFPVLGANLFYKGTDIPYAQPYAIIEREGIRIGVIGILGQDAATALIPSHIAGVEVIEPRVAVQEAIDLLRSQVDLVVLLTHQGKTAPMQTNDEDPSVKRDIEADIKLAGAVEGIDVLLGGHADAGTEEPVVHPQTGTLIMQTYGQGFHLGYLQLEIDLAQDKILSFEGKLIPVNSDQLEPHPIVAKKLSDYRTRYPEIGEIVGQTDSRLNRLYNQESDIGNLFADIIKEETQSSIGLIPSGGIRKDLPQGKITREDLLDAFPFTDNVVTLNMTGNILMEVLEQSLTLERGILQVSGIKVFYDLAMPEGQRVKNVDVDKKPLESDRSYQVATIQILAQGGDLYKPFLKAQVLNNDLGLFSQMLEDYFQSKELVAVPQHGRLIPK